MSWNYRVIKKRIPSLKEYHYFLAEVFYEKDGTLMAYSDDATPTGANKDEVIEVLKMMLKDAQSLPVLNEKDFFTGKTKGEE
jgi:hypothetical protein